VAVAECCIWGGRGARVTLPDTGVSPSHALFGEGPGRVVASCASDAYAQVEALAREAGVLIARLGAIGGDGCELRVATATARASVSSFRDAYENGLPSALSAGA